MSPLPPDIFKTLADWYGPSWERPWEPRHHVRAAGPHIGPTCSNCRTIHGSDAAVAIGRFRPEGVSGYRSRMGGPLRPTRKAAVADFCAMINEPGDG